MDNVLVFNISYTPSETLIRTELERVMDDIAEYMNLNLPSLIIQFLLGMCINLFVTIPIVNGFSMAGFRPTYSGFPVVMIHMFLGMLIGLTSIGILVLSIFHGSSKILIASAALFLSVLMAGINGLFFLFYGQNNLNSYLMSTGFILAVLFSMLLLTFSGQANQYSRKEMQG